ncbi:hypothetical protein BPOR_0394g00120 [Botrytis porri]|uniref:Amidase domain-containing protein n=1 Tax=Botrytis porri TaxID=87229 RepID=A0A4Z1KHB9_9HELO|nr:hypothetical protein BPOR_0394g00120 [Botrytis porri]
MPIEVNPIQSGITLVILGWIVSEFEFIQKLIYNNAGFTMSRGLDLGDATERYVKLYFHSSAEILLLHPIISFIATNVESVLAAAEKSAAIYGAGKSLGLLDGVSTAIKDASHIAGYRTTNGRAANDELFPISENSDWPIQELEGCGVIIFGKTNMYEYGTDTTGLDPYWGTSRNPHNRNCYTGGSPSGSA